MAIELSHAKGSVQEAARELGIDSSRITNWRQSHKNSGQLATAATRLSENQKLIKRLQKELKDAQLDRTAEAARYAKKGSRHLLQGRPRGGPWEIFRLIAEHANQFPVERMCKVLKVSSSGYYYWGKYPVGVRQLKRGQLLDDIRRVHAQSQSRYGSPRIADKLRERGVKVYRNRVAHLVHKAAIRSIMYKKYRVQTTDSAHDFPVAKNLLNREFTADKPGQKWVSDITYTPTGEGWLYLT